ncbi:hypothetical protein VCSRO136_2365 [Vibrio cholerae]|nr:hypothetical protein VCSRO136_2365 [Vibrio cholerae]
MSKVFFVLFNLSYLDVKYPSGTIMREEFQEQCLKVFFEGEQAFLSGCVSTPPIGLYGLKKRSWRRGYESAQSNALSNPQRKIEEDNAYEEAKTLGYHSYIDSKNSGILIPCPYTFGLSSDPLDEVRTTGWLDGEMLAKCGKALS